MERAGTTRRGDAPPRAASHHGRVACAAMVVAAAGLLAGALLGAPLLSILLAGLLLLCPVLLWAPIHHQGRSFDRLPTARRDDD